MSSNNTEQETPPPQPPRGVNTLVEHVSQNKIDVALWASRLLTIIFCIGYILPIFG